MITTTERLIDGHEVELVNGWRYHATYRQDENGWYSVLIYRVTPRLRKIGHPYIYDGLSRYQAEKFADAFNPTDGSIRIWEPDQPSCVEPDVSPVFAFML